MSFDEQPDGDTHGECAAEIHRLEQQRDELVAALKISDHNPMCAVRDRDAFDDREPCSCGRDAALAKVGTDKTAKKEHSLPICEFCGHPTGGPVACCHKGAM